MNTSRTGSPKRALGLVSAGLVLGCIALGGATAHAQTFTLQPGPADGKDTCWGTAYAGGGTPDAEDLYTGGWGDFYYDYFEFDIGAGPPAGDVVRAKMTFWFNATVNDPAFQVHRITQPWTEAGVTRGNNPAAVFAKDFGARVVASGFYTLDVTALYKDWKGGAYPNYGIKLVPTEPSEIQASCTCGHPTPLCKHACCTGFPNNALGDGVNAPERMPLATFPFVPDPYDGFNYP